MPAHTQQFDVSTLKLPADQLICVPFKPNPNSVLADEIAALRQEIAALRQDLRPSVLFITGRRAIEAFESLKGKS